MSATKTTIVALIIIALAFTAGLAVGVAADRFLIVRRGDRPPGGGPMFATEMMARRLDRELDLTPAQRGQVQQILDRRRARMMQLFEQSRAPMRAEIDATNNEISRILTPEQRTKFERIKMRMGPHRGARRHRPMMP